MLTIKFIGMVGEEAVYPAFSVEYRPAASKPPQGQPTPGEPPPFLPPKDTVIAFTEDHYAVAEFDTGTIFVMNERGQTVSRYDLGPSPVAKLGGEADDDRRHWERNRVAA